MADKEEKKTSKPARNATHSVAGGKVDELVEEVSKLTVLELSDLVAALQDKLGVTAAAPVAAAPAAATTEAGAPGGAPTAAATQTVVMTASGDNKIGVIKALREINQNFSLMEAKGMTETLPAEVLKDA